VSVAKRIVERPVLITVVFALVTVVGIYSIGELALDLFPQNEEPTMTVSTSWTGNSPASVEKLVTKPLEASLTSLEGLAKITSTTREGQSQIQLTFDYGTNLDAATNDIRDKLDRVKRGLPDDIDSPVIQKFDINAMPIMRIAVKGDRSREELRRIAEDSIAPRLLQASGVADVSASGGRTLMVRADLSRDRLEAYGLTVVAVGAALSSQSLELSGGKIQEGGKSYSIRTTGEFKSVEEIADAVVAQRGGYGVRLRDVAEVYPGYADETSSVYINGEPGVYLSVQKRSGANSVQAADSVMAKLGAVSRTLPLGVTASVIYDNTDQIRATLRDLVSSAVEGALLAMAFVFLFLRSMRPTLVIGLSIPMSIVVTLLAMYFAGLTLNMMTLTGLILGVGMIVDASIVIIDNVQAYRDRGAVPKVASMIGTQEMVMPITGSTLTTIVVFLPMIMFRRKLGRIAVMFESAMFTIVIALVASWLIALFFVPVLTSRYFPLRTRSERPIRTRLGRSLDAGVGSALDAMTKGHRALLAAALGHRTAAIAIAVALFAVALLAAPRMNIVFSPPMASDAVDLSVELPLGTPYEETKEAMLGIDAEARAQIKGYENVIASIGRSTASYSGSLDVTLPEADPAADSADTVKAKLRSILKEYPQARTSFSSGRGGFGQKADIEIYVSSDDLDAAMATADGIVRVIKAQVPEVQDARTNMNYGLPQVEVVIDRVRAYSFGLTVSAIAKEIDANMDGLAASTFNDAGEDRDVYLSIAAGDRQRVPDLGRIFVVDPSGDRIPVSEVASIRKSSGPVSIYHENQMRKVTITGSLSGLRADAAEAKIRAAVASSMVVDEGVMIEYSGSWSEVMSTGRTFLVVLVLAILLVFGVMAGQYESFKDPLINLFTVPLALFGVFLAHILTGQSFSMFTLMGLVMLVGIVVNNGIVLVDYTNLLRGRGVSLMEACMEAGESRLRPVLMTAVTTILGVIPMALFPSRNAAIMQPIGLCILGGLTSSTFITLLLIPVVYYLFNVGSDPAASAEREARRARRRGSDALGGGKEGS
jgi:HAE1 family hydrophobic/amphiphilic exporter-1